MGWPKGKPRGPRKNPGKVPGSGRKKGVPNKVTRDIRKLAQKHGPAVIKGLVEIMENKDHPQRVTAMKELLDRGYGKSAQIHAGPEGGDIVIRFVE